MSMKKYGLGPLDGHECKSKEGTKLMALGEDKSACYKRKTKPQKKMDKKQEKGTKALDYKNMPCEETFTCKVCGSVMGPENAGSSHRNHCSRCLSSLHVDNEPGDRDSLCKGIMDPIGVWVRKNGEWAIIHRCRLCGTLSSNRIAADDNEKMLFSIATKPLASPAFPLWKL